MLLIPPIRTLENICTICTTTPQLDSQLDLHERRDVSQYMRDALHLPRSNIRPCNSRLAVQTGERLVTSESRATSESERASSQHHRILRTRDALTEERKVGTSFVECSESRAWTGSCSVSGQCHFRLHLAARQLYNDFWNCINIFLRVGS